MIRTLLIIFLISLSGCTITKRLHRPGFHIEWNKNYSKSSNQVKKETFSAKQEAQTDKNADLDINLVEEKQELEHLAANDSVVGKTDRAVESAHSDTRLGVRTFRESKNAGTSFGIIRDAGHFLKSRNNTEGASSGILGGIGVILIVFGALLIIGSLFLLFGFNSLEGLFNSLVLSGNGFVVGLLGFILFLLILVVVLLFAAIVEYVLGGYYIGIIVGCSLVVVGLLLALINHLING